MKTTNNIYGREVYTIAGHKEIFFYRRVEAIKKTIEVAVKKKRQITMLLNNTPFCQFDSKGKYEYIYDASKDKLSSPELKQLFRDKGIAIN